MRTARIIGCMAVALSAALLAAASAPAASAAQSGRVVNVTLEAFDNPSEFVAVMTSRALVGGRFDYGPGMSVYVSRRYNKHVPSQVLTDCAGLYNKRVEQEYQARLAGGTPPLAKVPTYAVRRYGTKGVAWSNCHSVALVDGSSLQPIIDPRTGRQKLQVGPDLVTGLSTEPLEAYHKSGNTIQRRIRATRVGRNAAAHAWRVKRRMERNARKQNPAYVSLCTKLPRKIPTAHLSSVDGNLSRTVLTYRTKGRPRHTSLKTFVVHSNWVFEFTWADGTHLSC